MFAFKCYASSCNSHQIFVFTAHSIVPEKLCKFNAISTAMADFVDPIGAKRRKPYYPDPSEHFVTGEHFDDRTTFRMTYKAWSPKPQEVPKWARKPVYKRPTEGMALITRYRVSCPAFYILVRRKVSKGAKIRSRYNQVPHQTQDTNRKATNPQLDTTNESQEASPPPPPPQQATTRHTQTDAHKDTANIRQNKYIKDPQKKYRPGTVSKISHWRAQTCPTARQNLLPSMTKDSLISHRG